MPPHCEFHHEIHLKNNQMPPHSHIYPLSGTDLACSANSSMICLVRGSSDHPNHQQVHLFSLPRRRMDPCDSVLTSETSTRSLRRIGTQFHLLPTCWTNLAVQRSTPSLTSALATTMFMSQWAMSGRQPSKHNIAPLGSWSCLWDLPILPLCSKPS